MAKRSVRVVVGGGVGGLTTAVALAQCGVEVGFDREAASSVGFARLLRWKLRHRMNGSIPLQPVIGF
jgi:glycine/D-amino acid oxidase-like deaminating enzyme